ncbi:hypothetical protein AR457_36660 [Streptomyces agglomeratus]|uniref:Uncharacterized protein n=1 Tax=Streptomyces agglomeratus TaxID=285458 RepID=A0A1E5NYG9_9ACTN|nr:hypothetical protein AS594_37900 [Streptomyces agglomeratus]OEJ22795.1 hypothetical protein AR457_36660 [Streptomyces agglomeratus]
MVGHRLFEAGADTVRVQLRFRIGESLQVVADLAQRLGLGVGRGAPVGGNRLLLEVADPAVQGLLSPLGGAEDSVRRRRGTLR